MSMWTQYDVLGKILEVLRSVSYDHHFGGRPFITVYQIAIELMRRYPTLAADLGKEIGGAASGVGGNSLPLYLGKRLSDDIRDGKITDIEGSFLGNMNLREISFVGPDGQPIVSSLTNSVYPVSIYRLRDTA